MPVRLAPTAARYGCWLTWALSFLQIKTQFNQSVFHLKTLMLFAVKERCVKTTRVSNPAAQMTSHILGTRTACELKGELHEKTQGFLRASSQHLAKPSLLSERIWQQDEAKVRRCWAVYTSSFWAFQPFQSGIPVNFRRQVAL